MLKAITIVWWAAGLIIFSLVALNGGDNAWVGIILCAILLALSIFEWRQPEHPNDWNG